MNGSHDLHHLQVDQGGGDHSGDGGGGDGVQLKKGPWTAAEDSVLTEYVRKHGEGNWNAVQRNTGLARCGKSCRLRWANHLRPNLKKGAFSPEEERLIVELHAQLGNKWARMAAQLPGRTDNEIKNYWNTRVKRRHRQGLPLYPQEIQTQQHGGNHQHHPYHHQQYHHHHHHQQQQQQQLLQQQQTPQSSHSHHSHHHQSPASTPTTPTSSFTFSTTPTAAHHHHHYFSRSPTPNCLSPTPPPPLSPSSALHSPHYHHHQTLPTLSLFDSSTTTTNPTSFNVIHRAPPILQTPLRFKRFHADTTNSSGSATTTNSPCSTTTAANNFNTNYNNDHNNNNFNTNTYQNGNFSLPYSTFLRSPTSVSTPPPPQQPNCNAFSNTNSSTMLMSLHQQPPLTSNQNMVPFVSNNSSTSNILRTQFEKDYNSSSTNNNFPNNSVFAMKPELPSSQFYSHDHHNGSSTELAFIDNNNDQKLNLSGGGGSGLLEDLLDETTAHMSNSMEDKRDFSGFNNHWSDSNSLSCLQPKEETAAAAAAAAVDQNNNNNTTMHEDLSKIFNSINNPSMQLPAEWYNDTGTGSGEEASNGHSSVVTTDDNNMISLDQMHQIASMFRVDDSSSQEHDHHHLNLPGIC
ncbi:hypothetical protein LWI29_036629 [Acer saccharum]|uniref:Uncharacterized protein n=1 Tax=Acer saccharum TaxID=4024 RepID=A0AA39SPT1_ACESA|nr:hypothetical protein LWI29_036629 [Acer saccharum]